MTTRGLRGLAVVLLLLATLAFGVGVAIEKAEDGEHSERTESIRSSPEAGAVGDSDEFAPADAHGKETILGIETESTPLIVVGIALSLLVAAGVWRLGDRADAVAVGSAFCLGFAVLDAVEMSRKWGDETTIAVLALLAMLLHAAAAAVLGVTASRLSRSRPVPPA